MLGLRERLDLELIGHINGLVVQRDIIFEYVRDRWFLEDCLPRAFRLAGATIDTLVGMNVELIREMLAIIANVFVDAIDRTYADASSVDTINTKPGYRPWHSGKVSPEIVRTSLSCQSGLAKGFPPAIRI
jgi:hypothetical protein